MDMVFVYEDKIAQDAEGNYYTGSAFSQRVFDRYLQFFDRITLLMRKSDVNPNDSFTLSQMNKIDTSRIDVVCLPNLRSSFHNYMSPKIRREFRNTVINHIIPGRAVILRAPSDSGTIAADYCHAHGIPYLAEAVGCPWDSMWNHSLKGKMLAPRLWMNFRRTMHNADYAVYVTSEFLQHRYPTHGKSSAISDVELQLMDDTVLQRRLKKIQGHTGTIKLATAAALNAAYKGQQFVIKALALLKNEGINNYEYHLAGGGDRSSLSNLANRLGIADQVIFEGSLPHDEMFAWFDEMDIYIQPSLQEGLPRAVIEAMSRGLPALGAQTGGIPELLGKDCIFPQKNVYEIAEMLKSITEEKMIDMAEKNFEHAKQFQRDELDEKRSAFYSAFVKELEGNVL